MAAFKDPDSKHYTYMNPISFSFKVSERQLRSNTVTCMIRGKRERIWTYFCKVHGSIEYVSITELPGYLSFASFYMAIFGLV
jgi:hypothetical protein